MNLNLSLHTARVQAGFIRRDVRLWRAVPLAAFATLLVILAYGRQSDAAPQDAAAKPDCSLRTLRGAYGLVGSGVRGLGPGASESFTTVSIVT